MTKKYRALRAKRVRELGLTQEFERDFTGTHKMRQRYTLDDDGNPVLLEGEEADEVNQGEDKPADAE